MSYERFHCTNGNKRIQQKLSCVIVLDAGGVWRHYHFTLGLQSTSIVHEEDETEIGKILLFVPSNSNQID